MYLKIKNEMSWILYTGGHFFGSQFCENIYCWKVFKHFVVVVFYNSGYLGWIYHHQLSATKTGSGFILLQTAITDIVDLVLHIKVCLMNSFVSCDIEMILVYTAGFCVRSKVSLALINGNLNKQKSFSCWGNNVIITKLQ